MSEKEKEMKETAEEQAEETVEEVVEETVEEKAEETVDPAKALQEEIDTLKEELKAAKLDVVRAYADTENMRKRLQKEADTNKKYRFQSAALEILPIMDAMNMALMVQPEGDEAKNFAKGFEMIRTQLVTMLENEGVKEVEALNKVFDPNLMQALMQEKVEGVESGMVVEVLQKGYMLKDRILRPALVKVSE